MHIVYMNLCTEKYVINLYIQYSYILYGMENLVKLNKRL